MKSMVVDNSVGVFFVPAITGAHNVTARLVSVSTAK